MLAPIDLRPLPPIIIRMVLREDGSTYRRMHPAEYHRRHDSLDLEGVDGDEERNTVTYWFRPEVER